MASQSIDVMRNQTVSLLKSLKLVHFDMILAVYLVIYVLFSLFIWHYDPDIKDLSDALWFTFQTVTTIGYGDLLVTSVIGRFLTVVLAVYSMAIVAIFTGIIAGFYVEVVKQKSRERFKEFLEEMTELPNMSHEELVELAQRAKELADSK
jgi:voltage-gated potassium channel